MRQLLMYPLALSSWRTPLLWDWSSVCVWERADCWVSRAQGELATPCGVKPYSPPTHPRRCGLTGDRRTRFETICL